MEEKSVTIAEIKTRYVLPGFQNMGIGKMLLLEALNTGCKKYWLSVWYKNDKAIKFYKKQGFNETGEFFFDLYGDKIKNIETGIEV